MNNIRKSLLILFLLMLPWQTRYIFGDVFVMGNLSEYGRMSVYAFDIVLLLFLASSLHIFSKYTFLQASKSKPKLVALIALTAFVVFSFTSAMWAVEPMASLVFSTHLLLGALLFYILLVDENITADIVLASLAIGLLMPSAMGWIQSASQHIEVSTILGIASQDANTPGVAVVEYANGRWLRAYGAFPHPNIFGGFLAFGLVSLIAVVARGRMKRKELLLLLTAALMGGAVVMSASRGAWLAFVFGLAVFHFGHRINGITEQLKRASRIILTMATVIVLIALFMSPVLSARFDSANRLEERSTSERITQIEEAKMLITRSSAVFVAGAGAGNYTFALQELRPLREVYTYQPVHNIFALVFVELGAIGIILLITIMVASDWRTYKTWRDTNSLIAISLGAVILTIALTDHYLWTQVSGIYLLAIFLSMNFRLGSGLES